MYTTKASTKEQERGAFYFGDKINYKYFYDYLIVVGYTSFYLIYVNTQRYTRYSMIYWKLFLFIFPLFIRKYQPKYLSKFQTSRAPAEPSSSEAWSGAAEYLPGLTPGKPTPARKAGVETGGF